MAHFAKLDENNIVLAVHVVNNDVITIDGVESEQAGIDFLTELHGHSLWKKTSYNAKGGGFRKNFAGIGYIYNPSIDAFHTPQPFPSWTLDSDTGIWNPPIPYPSEGHWSWDESNQVWVESV